MRLPTQYYSKDMRPHLRAEDILALLTDKPETAAALAARSGISGMTAQVAGRILGCAATNGKIWSKRDTNQCQSLFRMVYWRKL